MENIIGALLACVCLYTLMQLVVTWPRIRTASGLTKLHVCLILLQSSLALGLSLMLVFRVS